jgi:hypothetical protein
MNISDTPALSPEEWNAALNGKTRHTGDCAMFANEHDVTLNFGRQSDEVIDSSQRHALAALCLYQQRFGFSHEDVKLLDALARSYGDAAYAMEQEEDRAKLAKSIAATHRVVDGLESLASRIRSLLPPQPSTWAERLEQAIQSYKARAGDWPRRVVLSSDVRSAAIGESREAARAGTLRPADSRPALVFFSDNRLPPGTFFCDDGSTPIDTLLPPEKA